MSRFTFLLFVHAYWDADKFLALPNVFCLMVDGENILFDASLFIHINTVFFDG